MTHWFGNYSGTCGVKNLKIEFALYSLRWLTEQLRTASRPMATLTLVMGSIKSGSDSERPFSKRIKKN